MTEPIVTPRTETPEVELRRLMDAAKAMQRDFRRGYADATVRDALLEIRTALSRLSESCGYTPEELEEIARRPRRRGEVATY